MTPAEESRWQALQDAKNTALAATEAAAQAAESAQRAAVAANP